MSDQKRAVKLGLATCGCPHVHLLLLDESDEVVTQLSISPDDALSIARDLAEMGAMLRAQDKDAIGVCQGHA